MPPALNQSSPWTTTITHSAPNRSKYMRELPRPDGEISRKPLKFGMALSPCVIWLDRATPRTGTRSTQQLMARLSRAGHALHRTTLILGGAINYEHSAHEWRNLLSSAASCGAAASSSSSSVIRLAVQSFSGNELNEWTNAAAELRRLRPKSFEQFFTWRE